MVLGGEQQPSAELMELSTVPMGTAARAHRYLAEGGPANLAQLHAFLSDTVLLTGEGFELPVTIPARGWADRPAATVEPAKGLPPVDVLYYRAHEASGINGFAHALAYAIEATGRGLAVPIFAGSLRSAPDGGLHLHSPAGLGFRVCRSTATDRQRWAACGNAAE